MNLKHKIKLSIISPVVICCLAITGLYIYGNEKAVKLKKDYQSTLKTLDTLSHLKSDLFKVNENLEKFNDSEVNLKDFNKFNINSFKNIFTKIELISNDLTTPTAREKIEKLKSQIEIFEAELISLKKENIIKIEKFTPITVIMENMLFIEKFNQTKLSVLLSKVEYYQNYIENYVAGSFLLFILLATSLILIFSSKLTDDLYFSLQSITQDIVVSENSIDNLKKYTKELTAQLKNPKLLLTREIDRIKNIKEAHAESIEIINLIKNDKNIQKESEEIISFIENKVELVECDENRKKELNLASELKNLFEHIKVASLNINLIASKKIDSNEKIEQLTSSFYDQVKEICKKFKEYNKLSINEKNITIEDLSYIKSKVLSLEDLNERTLAGVESINIGLNQNLEIINEVSSIMSDLTLNTSAIDKLLNHKAEETNILESQFKQINIEIKKLRSDSIEIKKYEGEGEDEKKPTSPINDIYKDNIIPLNISEEKQSNEKSLDSQEDVKETKKTGTHG